MKFLGFILLYFGLYIIWAGTFGAQGHTDFVVKLIHVLVGGAISGLGSLCFEKASKAEQKEVDSFVERIIESKDFKPGFWLYLRPFELDQRISTDHSSSNIFDLEQYTRSGKDSLERILGDSIRNNFRLVGFGLPSDSISGFGRLGLHEDWKLKVSELMNKAALILVLPSSNPGTRWEIEELVENKYLSKTIFIMPPSTAKVELEQDLVEHWNSNIEALNRYTGLDFPSYDPKGCIFAFDKTSKVYGVAGIPMDPRGLAKAFNQLFDQPEFTYQMDEKFGSRNVGGFSEAEKDGWM